MHSITRKKRLRFHESTQRTLCRLLFLWLALAPVLFVVGLSISMLTPWFHRYQRDHWQRRLSDNLGVAVTFESIRFPSPNQFRISGLVCSNPETGREILKVPHANVSMDRSGWSVDLSSPQLNGNELQNTMDLVHNWFLCRPQKTASLLALTLPELSISDGAFPLKLQNVQVALEPKESTSTLIVKFSLEGAQTARPARFRIDRDHVDESTTWQLESNDALIPCVLLSERFPSLKYLGSQARFQGIIQWWQGKNSWKTNIHGDTYAIDFQIATFPLQNPLNGIGDIHIDNATIVDGDLRRLDGYLKSPVCSFDTAWLDRASNSLKLFANQENISWKRLGERVQASQLGIRFSLTSNGLLFTGDPQHQNFAAYFGPQREIAASLTDLVAENAMVSHALSTYSKPAVVKAAVTSPQPSRLARNPQ